MRVCDSIHKLVVHGLSRERSRYRIPAYIVINAETFNLIQDEIDPFEMFGYGLGGQVTLFGVDVKVENGVPVNDCFIEVRQR